jgi:hypothetical protein
MAAVRFKVRTSRLQQAVLARARRSDQVNQRAHPPPQYRCSAQVNAEQKLSGNLALMSPSRDKEIGETRQNGRHVRDAAENISLNKQHPSTKFYDFDK